METIRSIHDTLIEGLSHATGVRISGDDVCVTTHCMYPSGTLVRVMVRGGHETVQLSDDGEALGEALAAGMPPKKVDSMLAHLVRERGLKIKYGIIYSEPIPLRSVTAGVLALANVARDVAAWMFEHNRLKPVRDFMPETATPAEVVWQPGETGGSRMASTP